MKPEKMTDERLRYLRDHAPGLDEQEAKEVLAEVVRARDSETALTAERDEAERERNALHERVTALEAECATQERGWDDAETKVSHLESRLAAMRRQWSVLEEVLSPSVVLGYLSAHPPHVRAGVPGLTLGWEALERLGALFNENANPDAPAPSEPLNPDAYSEADQSIPEGVELVLDIPSEMDGLRGEMAEKPENVCEHGNHPAPAGQRFCSATCQRCESTDYDGDGCAGLCTTANPEPTAAEAFATVLDGLHCGAAAVKSPTGKEAVSLAEAALSLLERRMGTMVRALSGCRAHLKCTDGCTCDVCAALTGASAAHALEEAEERAREVYEAAIARREHQPVALSLAVREAVRLAPSGTVSASGACDCGHSACTAPALADAPPVFTLEELREVLHEGGYGTEDFETLRHALSALRKG